jgi:hypothetical protein
MAGYDYVNAEGSREKGTFLMDFTGKYPFVMRSKIQPLAMFHEIKTGKLFYLQDQAIYEWDANDNPGLIANWKSKEFVLPRPDTMGAILVEVESKLTPAELKARADFAEVIKANNQALVDAGALLAGPVNESLVNEYPVNGNLLQEVPGSTEGFISVIVYADKVPIHVLTKYNDMDRLPSGFKARTWEVEVSSTLRVNQITLAKRGVDLNAV